MSQPLSVTTSIINLPDLQTILEPLLRQIVREELERMMKAYLPAVSNSSTFYLEDEMPLHADMTEILTRQTKGQIKLFSHQEVWDE